MDHCYSEIPGNFTFSRHYSDLVAEAKDGDIIVEVGAWKGRSAAYMACEIANSGKRIQFFVVDMWDDATHLRKASPHPYEPATFEEFTRNMAPVEEHYKPLQLASVDAAKNFADGSCFAVFIDACHSYPSVKADIEAWYPKVRPGGILSGHDWGGGDDDGEYPGVARAVREAFRPEDLWFPEHQIVWATRVK